MRALFLAVAQPGLDAQLAEYLAAGGAHVGLLRQPRAQRAPQDSCQVVHVLGGTRYRVGGGAFAELHGFGVQLRLGQQSVHYLS